MIDTDTLAATIANLGEYIYRFFSDVNSMYLASFLFLTFMIFAIVLALIGRVPGLGDGTRANRSGKAVAFAIAFISGMSIYSLKTNPDKFSVLEKVLPVYGVFAGAVLCILFFSIIYFGFSDKDHARWQLAIIGIGLAMAVAGYFITSPALQATGWFLGALGLLIYLLSTSLIKEASGKAKAAESKPKELKQGKAA